jgi:hypothetical protein
MPTVDPYTKLKDAILSRTTASDEARLQQLLSGVELGDRTPSQLLRYMRSLAGNSKVDDSVIRTLWTKCLPANTRLVLSTHDASCPLEKLAETADKVHECFFSSSVHHVTSPNVPQSSLSDEISQLQQQIATLSTKVDQLTKRSSRPRATSRSRHSSRSRFPSQRRPSPSQSHICYYHRRFGDNARKCTLPCAHPKAFNGFSSTSGNAAASQ